MIPFEIHITVADLKSYQLDGFLEYCTQAEGKPILIELSKGDFIHQPMFSKVLYSDDFEAISSEIEKQKQGLMHLDFNVNRVKIEIPAKDFEYFNKPFLKNFKPYFEWHGKITYQNQTELNTLCHNHKAHLSLNALKNDKNSRFVTLREFSTYAIFKNRIESILEDLNQGQWTILKQEAEYCIFDDNIFLDKGWLPK
jgi:hypothetical protein